MELYAGLNMWTFGAEAAALKQSTDIQALLKIAASVPQSVFDAARKATPAEMLQERRPRWRREASQRIRIVKKFDTRVVQNHQARTESLYGAAEGGVASGSFGRCRCGCDNGSCDAHKSPQEGARTSYTIPTKDFFELAP